MKTRYQTKGIPIEIRTFPGEKEKELKIIRLSREHKSCIYITWKPGICLIPVPNGTIIFDIGDSSESGNEFTVKESVDTILAKLGEIAH